MRRQQVDVVENVRNLVRQKFPIRQATQPPGRNRPIVNFLVNAVTYPHGNPLFQSLFGAFLAFLFWYFFNSLFLALLCVAFFVFFPERTSVGGGATPTPGPNPVDRTNNIIFIFMMIAILFLAFVNAPLLGIGLEFSNIYNPAGWDASTIIFLVMWLISFFSGMAGRQNRQSIGVIMVIICFFIFTVGVGTQAVGKAAFGAWWPTVYKFGSNIFGPLVDGLSHFMETMGRGLELITNPVGVANRIASGNYIGDPTTGSKGALGVKIDKIDVTPIFPHQPFEITVKLKNEGAVDAENVEVGLEVGEEAPGEFDSIVLKNPYTIIKDAGFIEAVKKTVKIDLNQQFLTMKHMGFENGTEKVGDPPGHMEKKYTDEIFFRTNPEGMPCEVVASYQVRSQYIPITATVTYDYSTQSNLPLEVVSKEELARRVVEGIGEQQRKVSASLSNAPIKLNLDAPEQPIREGRPIFIALALENAQKKGKIETVENLRLNYPEELEFSRCTLAPTVQEKNQLIWEKVKPTSVIFCDFKLAKPLTDPSQSYLVRAEANFTYKSIKSTVATMEFGGGCCYDTSIATTSRTAECPSGTECDWKPGKGSPGNCLPTTGGGATTPTLPAKYRNVNMTYCNGVVASGGLCDLGEGHCGSSSQCQQTEAYGVKPDSIPSRTYKLGCRKLSNIPEFAASGFSVCCPEGASTEQCLEGYKAWVDGKPVFSTINNPDSRNEAVKAAYRG